MAPETTNIYAHTDFFFVDPLLFPKSGNISKIVHETTACTQHSLCKGENHETEVVKFPCEVIGHFLYSKMLRVTTRSTAISNLLLSLIFIVQEIIFAGLKSLIYI